MELGKASLRRCGGNALLSAVHPKHGLAWTDGVSVYLVPVTVTDDEVDNESSVKLGEFDHVDSLHWSCDQGAFVYLCVVHHNTVSLWKVDGTVPDLNLKQIRKIHASPIPQGCLWNPCRDILCILNKDQCSFYFRHTQSKGSYALPPIESGRICCGCWATDGNKLVIGIGSIILIYQWPDIDKSISDFTITAWKIPSVDGRISTMVCISQHMMLCTAELPLDDLCKRHAYSDNLSILDTESGEENGVNVLPSTEDDDIIRPSNVSSHKDSLLNLPRNKSVETESSQLILFDVQGAMLEPAKIASIPTHGILSPDLLCFEASSSSVIVGSNTQRTLLVYRVADNTLAKIHQTTLPEDERPKGVCGPHFMGYGQVEGVLLLVGRLHCVDNTFLPPSTLADYELRLQYQPLVPGSQSQLNSRCNSIPGNLFKEIQLPNGNTKVHLLRINPLRNNMEQCEGHLVEDVGTRRHVSFKTHEGSKPGSPTRELLLPPTTGTPKLPSTRNRMQLVDVENEINRELETESSGFADQFPNFKNKLKKFFEQKTNAMLQQQQQQQQQQQLDTNLSNTNGEMTYPVQRSSKVKQQQPKQQVYSDVSCSVSMASETESDTALQLSQIEAQIRSQGHHISKLQQKLEEMASAVQESVGSTLSKNYKPASNPDLVFLVYKSLAGTENRKAFLLDSGKLQLDMVKQAFGLQTVELLIGDVPCVLGCNSEGHIPLRFSPNSTMYVTGRRSPPGAISNC